MTVRLTLKKRIEMLKRIDDIISLHRVRLFQQLQSRIDQTNADAVQEIVSDMGESLRKEVRTQFDDLLSTNADENHCSTR